MNTIRVLLVDDHRLFRRGVAAALAEAPDIQVVGEAHDGLQAVAKSRETDPHVVLMDIAMPGMDGLEATRRIKAELPHVRIVILTVAEDDENLFEAIKSGAQGYLLKSVEPRALMETLRSVFQGGASISRTMAPKILAEFSRQARAADTGARPGAGLTDREREVLALVAKGGTNKEIATTLGISPKTAKNHLQNILEKLHVENRVQAATFAFREGLAPNPPSKS